MTISGLSAAHEIEAAVVEIEEAISAIQLLLPDDAPATRDQQTLQAVGYVACSMRPHVAECHAALARLYEARRATRPSGKTAAPAGRVAPPAAKPLLDIERRWHAANNAWNAAEPGADFDKFSEEREALDREFLEYPAADREDVYTKYRHFRFWLRADEEGEGTSKTCKDARAAFEKAMLQVFGPGNIEPLPDGPDVEAQP